MTDTPKITEADDVFTPSTEQVRAHYVFDQNDQWKPERGERFDRWLSARDATLLEAAAKEADRGYLRSENCDDIAARIRALGTLDAVKAQTEPPTEDVREALATIIQETFPHEGGGYALVWEDCFPAADAILERFAVSPKKGQDK